MKRFHRFLRILGPGLITGAADDDPSGIATYSQTGAQFGYGQLWTVVFLLPFLAAVQEICARIGMVTGKGIAAAVKAVYGRKILYPVVLLVAVANIINIGADLGAMASAVQLVLPDFPFFALLLVFTLGTFLLEVFTSYARYAKILKWTTVALLAYPLTLFFVSLPWPTLAVATFVPHIELSFEFLFIITGVFGTTISPYMFFWQASEEAEEHVKPTLRHIKTMRLDTILGMTAAQIATWCIIVTTATVLHANGITDIQTAADAAKALEPLAGPGAKALFAAGIVGLGMLAVPVLAGSASYAVSEAFGWKAGLSRNWRRAKGFYGVMGVAMGVGFLMNILGVDPIKALVFTAVFNGIAAVPLLFVIIKIGAKKDVMGEFASGTLSKILTWTTFGIMAAAGIGMLVSQL